MREAAAIDTFARFTRWLAASLLVLCLLSIAVVIVMDPYRLFGTPDIPGFNAVKPYPEHYQSDIKSALALRQQAKGLLLGNSRMELGFDPAYAGFPDRVRPVYDMGIPGVGIEHSVELLASLLARGLQPRLVILGIELSDFFDAPGATAIPAVHADTLKWRSATTFSLMAIGDAVVTWTARHEPLQGLTAQGFNPLREYEKLARQEGYQALFRQKAEQTAKTYAHLRTMRLAEGGQSSSLAALHRLFALCAEHGIALELVMYPTHAQALALLEAMQLWPAFEDWKRLVVREVESAKARRDLQVRVWDFSGFGGARCEAIPAAGDRTHVMQWYWESAHFKPVVGNDMLTMILAGDAHAGKLIDGTLLGVDTLDESIRRVSAQRQACHAAHPEIFADAQQVAVRFAADRRH